MYQVQNFMSYLLPALAASVFFVGMAEIMLKIRKEKISWFHRIVAVILGLYLSVVFSLTLSSGITLSMPMSGNNINLLPFRVFHTISANPLNFYGNILMFAPFGLLLVLYSKRYKHLLCTLSAGAGLSLFIELLQLFGIRSTDIDDVILNTAGTLCGYMIGRAILLLAPSIGDKTEVGIMSGEKGRKKRNPGSIAVLTLFVLTSFFLSGYTKIDYEPNRHIAEQRSVTPAPVPEVNTAKAVSAEISAKNAYLWNISSNTVLYEKESDQRIAPASTAKMLTELTVLEFCEEEEAVRVGAVHSEFKNPDGYDSEGQFTTAYDLARIAKAFCETGILNEIAGSSQVYDHWLSGQQATFQNTNELILPESRYYYKHATGLKTGRSKAAGCCLVSAPNMAGEWYIGIVMGSPEEGRWTDSLALYRSIEAQQ